MKLDITDADALIIVEALYEYGQLVRDGEAAGEIAVDAYNATPDSQQDLEDRVNQLAREIQLNV